jgi:hypothetical protein
MPGDTRFRRELSRAAREEQSAQAYATARRALFPSATPQIPHLPHIALAKWGRCVAVAVGW